MFHIQRDESGEILSVARQPDAQHNEPLAPGEPELRRFLASSDDALGQLQSSDVDFIRVLEDLIDLMINKDLIQFTELPDAAQQKLLSRRQIRERLISSLSTSSTLLSDTPQGDSLI
ncbi:MAG: tryptophan synthase subunit beta like protein [Marinobacterium sp.]|nr:tryptophan synthase subunit beta like protein [Marinobacterium sp.]